MKINIGKIQINISNKWLYTLIAIGILAIIGVGVYAWANPTTGVGHSHSEIEPCADGQVLQMSGGVWSCVSGGTDTRCDTSGTCSQVCIGTDCQSSWPESFTKSRAFYKVINSRCSLPDEGHFTLSPICYTYYCGYHIYWSCSGTCSVHDSPAQCPNQLLGYFVN